jgi:hypothetical protein
MTTPENIVPVDARFEDCVNLYLESQGWDGSGLWFILSRCAGQVVKAMHRLTFPHGRIFAFRMIFEECRLNEWRERSMFPGVAVLSPSPWLDKLKAQEALVSEFYTNARHYIVNTQDECFDVLTTGDAPTIVEVPPHEWSRFSSPKKPDES